MAPNPPLLSVTGILPVEPGLTDSWEFPVAEIAVKPASSQFAQSGKPTSRKRAATEAETWSSLATWMLANCRTSSFCGCPDRRGRGMRVTIGLRRPQSVADCPQRHPSAGDAEETQEATDDGRRHGADDDGRVA